MPAWEITRKDLKLLMRDRRALVVLVLFPLIFITIIGLTTGKLLGWRSENQLIRIAVVDEVDYRTLEDQPARKLLRDANRQRHLVRKFLNRIQGRHGMQVVAASNRREAERMVDSQSGVRANAALFIGPTFAERVNALEIEDIVSPGDEPLTDRLKQLDLVLDSNTPESSTHAIIEQLVYSNAIAAAAPYVFCSYRSGNVLENARIKQSCGTLQDEAQQPPPPLAPPHKAKVVSDDRVYRALVPSYTVMFVFFLVNIMARSFLQERDLGTLRRLRIAPLGPSSVLAGKVVPFFIVSVVQTVLLFLCGRFLFDMSWGPEPWLLGPVIVCTSMAATGLGLLIATWVRTDSQVSAYANFVVITMAGISGCFMPRDWLPPEMLTVSLATPHAWALIAYEQILQEAHPDVWTVFGSSGMLALFAAVFFAVGCLRFGRLD